MSGTTTTTTTTATGGKLRVLFALSGLHRVNRGAEVALEEVGARLARRPDFEVTLLGSGAAREGAAYRYVGKRCLPREKFLAWPKFPYLRTHYSYEELSFVPALISGYNPADFDVTLTCGYPYANWVLRARRSGGSPRHVFVTQNGDWMVQGKNWEFRHFGCDGLICTNPEYFERHRDRYPSVLIPNGVDPARFSPGEPERERLGLPASVPLVLAASALIPSKRVAEAVQAVSLVPDAHLVVAGDGEERANVLAAGAKHLGGRFRHVRLPRSDMPALYRSVDAMIHMSQDEPSANVYMEAMSVGVPIVTHDRQVTRWTLGDSNYFVDTGDLPATAGALRVALSEDRGARRAARRERVVERFSWDIIADSYAAFFREVAGSRPAAGKRA